MNHSKTLLPLSGGNSAERLLRDRGRGRSFFARLFSSQLRKTYSLFCAGRWRPPVPKRSSAVPISLTSWPPRFADLPLVLLCLIQQSVKPREIVVWLVAADKKLLDPKIERLFKPHGVRIAVCDDLKPHKKWLPMIESGHAGPFVICDDDIVYPYEWFEALVSEDRSDAYVGAKCHEIVWNAAGAARSYSDWKRQIQWTGAASHSIFVTGCGGAVIHPERIPKSFLDRNEIMRKCPKADDIWLKAAHVAAGIPSYKTQYSFPCLELPGTNASGLAQTNVDEGGNDRQIENMAEWFRKVPPVLN